MRIVGVLCVLFVLCGVSVSGALVERYESSATCSARVRPNSVTIGYVSGTCYGQTKDKHASSVKLTCSIGGAVKIERFSTLDCTGTASSETGTDKSCTDGYSYVDCGSDTVSAAISQDYYSSQSFSDASCNTVVSGTDGLKQYGFANASQCVSEYDSYSHAYRSSGNWLVNGGAVHIEADGKDCTQWRSVNFSPLDSCVPNLNDDGTKVYTRLTGPSNHGSNPLPISFPPAGNHVQTIQCSDKSCANDCMTVAIIRTGYCRASDYKDGVATEWSSYGLSADGKYLIESYYNADGCAVANRVYVEADPIGKAATCGSKDSDPGTYNAAAAPSGASDSSLTQLPLPPVVAQTYYSNDIEQVFCNDTSLLAQTIFTEENKCADGSKYTIGGTEYITTQHYNDDSCTTASGDPLNITQNTCNPSPHSASKFSSRKVSATQTGPLGVLAGWYSTNPADNSASSAYNTGATAITPGGGNDLPSNDPFKPNAATPAAHISVLAVLVAAVAFLARP